MHCLRLNPARRPLLLAITMAAVCGQAHAQTNADADAGAVQGQALLKQADEQSRDRLVSPVQRIERQDRPAEPAGGDPGFPSIDGSGNDLGNPNENAADQPLRRRIASAYGDGASSMAGADRPSPRLISNLVHAQDQHRPNLRGASDFLWQWGQFIDHDIDLSDGTDPAELAPIAVPAGDPWFDPGASGTAQIIFNRSIYDRSSGSGPGNPRQQLNELSGWLDASMVYGSDATRASALRGSEGGKLAQSDAGMMPYNTGGLPNAGGSGAHLYLAGDVRANEQLALTAMHTLFVREHNHWAARLALAEPLLDDETLYQRARMIVAAEIQVITYAEFLPLLLGPAAIPPWSGYRPEVDSRIANVFSTAAFRLGHSLLSPQLLRLQADGTAIAEGHLPLREAFFAPQRLAEGGGIEPLLRGLASQRCQELDIYVIDDVRNFLFGAPGSGGFDLPALNIQRGRDHGLPGYTALRQALGMKPVGQFADIGADPQISARLASAYANVDAVDAWTGLLAEPHARGAMVGPTLQRLIADQFIALRDGDRYWYRNWMPVELRSEIEATRLADIIRRNTDIGNEIADNVFLVRADQPLRPGGRR